MSFNIDLNTFLNHKTNFKIINKSTTNIITSSYKIIMDLMLGYYELYTII